MAIRKICLYLMDSLGQYLIVKKKELKRRYDIFVVRLVNVHVHGYILCLDTLLPDI